MKQVVASVFVLALTLVASACGERDFRYYLDASTGVSLEIPGSLPSLTEAVAELCTGQGGVIVRQKTTGTDDVSIKLNTFEWPPGTPLLDISAVRASKLRSVGEENVLLQKSINRDNHDYFLIRYTELRREGVYHILSISAALKSSPGIGEVMIISAESAAHTSPMAARLINSFEID